MRYDMRRLQYDLVGYTYIPRQYQEHDTNVDDQRRSLMISLFTFYSRFIYEQGCRIGFLKPRFLGF